PITFWSGSLFNCSGTHNSFQLLLPLSSLLPSPSSNAAIPLTMSNYTQEVLPNLQTLVTSAPSKGPRTAYVTAGPVGKSTRLVPDLWKYTKMARPNAQGIYVVASEAEAFVLGSYLSASCDTEISSRELAPYGSGKLCLLSYRDFQMLYETEEFSSMVNSKDVVLFVDVKDQPTITSEWFMATLIRWVDQLLLQGDSEIRFTMVMLAAGFDETLRLVLQRHHIEPLQIKWRESSIDRITITEIESDEEVQDRIHSIVLQPIIDDIPFTSGLPGPCVIIFGDVHEIGARLLEPLRIKVGISAENKVLNEASPPEYVLDCIYSEAPRVISVESGFSASLAVPNLQYVASLPLKRVRIFDRQTSQFPISPIMLSVGDVDRQKAWIYKAGNTFPAVDGLKYHIRWTLTQLVLHQSRADAEIEGQMMRFCLETSTALETVFSRKTNFTVLEDHALAREAGRRLENMRCLTSGTFGVKKATKLGHETLKYIKSVQVNPKNDFHLGNLLAQIKTNSSLSLKAKRVLIRMAAITAHRPLIQTDWDYMKRMYDEDGEVLNVIRADCAGIGQKEVCNGQLWLELGIWTKVRTQGISPELMTLTDNRFHIPVAGGHIQVLAQTSLDVARYVQDVEKSLHLDPCKDLVKETMLSESERWEVLETLTWAYLHRIVLFPIGLPDDPAVDLISHQRVRLSDTQHAISLKSINTGDAKYGGNCAIYQEAAITEGELAPYFLMLLPRGMMNKIVKHFGNDISLSALLLSSYPVPRRSQ
ncbi:hypothetical protein M426DRAFT_261072, partial [Hypoxylon sp. CI-4A]